MRAVLLLALVLLMAAPAAALGEDLSGRYQGPAPQNAIMDLTQTGNLLQGQLQAPNGVITLQGQATGTQGTGTIVVPGVGQANFEAQLTGQILLMRIFDPGKTTEVSFTRIGPVGTQVPPVAAGQPAAVSYYVSQNGANFGPLTLQQVLERIQQGATTADQQVWKSDTQAWTRADALPELQAALPQVQLPVSPPAAAAVAYYVVENGANVGPLTLPQVLERVQRGATTADQQVWKSDTQAWTRADALPELQGALPQPATGVVAAPAVTYYVSENGANVGPLTLQQVLDRVHQGATVADQQVWKSDTQLWSRADAVPELQAVLQPAVVQAPAAVMYYVAEAGTAVGPLSLQQLVERMQAGGATRDQQIWKTDTQVWVRADSLPELQAVLPQPSVPTPPPPPPPAAAAVMYYLAENGVAAGPLTLQQMRERAQAGGLAAEQQVWKTDTQVWGRADALPELQGAPQPPATPAAVDAGAAAPQGNTVTAAPAAADTGSPAATAPVAQPAVDAAGTDEAILAVGLQIATADNPDRTSQALNDTAACFAKALTPLTPEEKVQFLADIKSGTPPTDGRRLDQEFPGLVAAFDRLEPRYPGLARSLERCG